MSITYQTVIGEDGQPAAALIPWNVFVKLQDLIDDEPTPEEIEAVTEAEADRRSGNAEAFVPLTPGGAQPRFVRPGFGMAGGNHTVRG